MKRAIIVGLIAGFIAGIVQAFLDISGIYQLFSDHPASLPISIYLSMQNIMLSRIILYSLWGIIWGALYSFFYDHIPGKGLKKGLIFSLLVWIAVTFHPAIVIVQYGFDEYFIPWVLTGFFSVCITYGLLIGYLCKKGN